MIKLLSKVLYNLYLYLVGLLPRVVYLVQDEDDNIHLISLFEGFARDFIGNDSELYLYEYHLTWPYVPADPFEELDNLVGGKPVDPVLTDIVTGYKEEEPIAEFIFPSVEKWNEFDKVVKSDE